MGKPNNVAMPDVPGELPRWTGSCSEITIHANKRTSHSSLTAHESIVVNVPADVSTTVGILPWTMDHSQTIPNEGFTSVCVSPPKDRTELLKPLKVIQELTDDPTDIECKGLIKKYAARPKLLENYCLADLASWFDISTKKKQELLKMEMNRKWIWPPCGRIRTHKQ